MGKEKIDSVRAHRKYGKFPKNTGRDNKRERIQDNLGKFFNKAKNDLKEKSNKTEDIEELQQNFILFFDGVKKQYPKLEYPSKKYDETHIAKAEKTMNLSLNEELREWFQIIGDTKFGLDEFFAGLELYDLDEMQKEWKIWRDFDNDEELNDAKYYSSDPEGAVKCRYTNPLWIPLAHDYGSNYIGVDLDPDVNGTAGQVIDFGRDENDKKVLAGSIKELLRLFIQYQSELFVEKDEDGDYYYTNEDDIHTIDWLKGKTV